MHRDQVHIDLHVSFALGDVATPKPLDVLQGIGPQLRLTGRVTFLSSGEEGENQFAVVHVPGVASPLIVPVSCVFVDSDSQRGRLPDAARVSDSEGQSAFARLNSLDASCESAARMEFDEVNPAPPTGGARV